MFLVVGIFSLIDLFTLAKQFMTANENSRRKDLEPIVSLYRLILTDELSICRICSTCIP